MKKNVYLKMVLLIIFISLLFYVKVIKAQTATPTPTETPIPTVTPLPTATPSPTATPGPTATPIATPTPLTPNLPASTTDYIGTKDYCQQVTATKTVLNQGNGIEIMATAKNSDIKRFTYRFLNNDNLTTANKPKPIMFTAAKPYGFQNSLTVTSSTNKISLGFIDFDRKDFNWNYYMPKPKNVRVEVYFQKTDNTNSKLDENCVINFRVNSIDPTPTPNINCKCSTTGNCSAVPPCFFDKFPAPTGFIYANPIKCNLSNSLFPTPPTADQKTGWCRAYLRVRGDANADGKVNLLDYFYYVSVQAGSKVPATINIDFNGDNLISSVDRVILIKSLK